MRAATLEWTWGDRIRKLRKALDLNQAEFANLVGLRVGTVAGWEASDGKPRHHVETAQHIARSLGVVGLDIWLLGMGEAPSIEPEEAPVTHRYPNEITAQLTLWGAEPTPSAEVIELIRERAREGLVTGMATSWGLIPPLASAG